MNVRTLPFFAYQRLGLLRALLFCLALLLMQYAYADDMDPCRFMWAVRMVGCQ